MQFLPSLLFGISASLDALLVSIGYGLRGIRIRTAQNLFISLMSLLGTCLSVCAGSRLPSLLPAAFAESVPPGWIGSVILMLLGVYYITKWLFSGLKSCKETSGKKNALVKTSAENPCLSYTETLFLSLSLSANNIGIGISASMAGIRLLPTAVTTFLCSALFLLLGNRLGGSRLLHLTGSAADLISGLLLIGLGLIQLML